MAISHGNCGIGVVDSGVDGSSTTPIQTGALWISIFSIIGEHLLATYFVSSSQFAGGCRLHHGAGYHLIIETVSSSREIIFWPLCSCRREAQRGS